MTTKRVLLGAVLLAAVAGRATAQYGMPPYAPPGRPTVPGSTNVQAIGPDTGVALRGPQLGEPPPPSSRPPAASLEQMTIPPPPGSPVGADPVGTLAGPGANGLPPGSYASPWYTDGPGCCGPLGRNGRVGYDLYFSTGPVMVFGGEAFTGHLKTGWGVVGGGRTLFFNQTHDAAWLVDLGLSYQYNRGQQDPLGLFIRQNPVTNTQTGTIQRRPDLFVSARIRGLHRTAFNFAFGRDWWVWGPGNVGGENGWNLRVGGDVGGRWGTAHVDLVPQGADNLYARRQKVFEGLTLSAHADLEAPLGGWIWFGGLRVQYGIDWMNIVPPIPGDVQYLNILMTTGVRF